MKLHYQGTYNSDPATLPRREHLPGAVQFKEVEDIKKLGIIVNVICLFLIVLLAIPAIIRCLPYSRESTGQLFLTVLGVFGIASGAGDYLNVFHAITQMPKHSRTYLNGFHSYWYLP